MIFATVELPSTGAYRLAALGAIPCSYCDVTVHAYVAQYMMQGNWGFFKTKSTFPFQSLNLADFSFSLSSGHVDRQNVINFVRPSRVLCTHLCSQHKLIGRDAVSHGSSATSEICLFNYSYILLLPNRAYVNCEGGRIQYFGKKVPQRCRGRKSPVRPEA